MIYFFCLDSCCSDKHWLVCYFIWRGCFNRGWTEALSQGRLEVFGEKKDSSAHGWIYDGTVSCAGTSVVKHNGIKSLHKGVRKSPVFMLLDSAELATSSVMLPLKVLLKKSFIVWSLKLIISTDFLAVTERLRILTLSLEAFEWFCSPTSPFFRSNPFHPQLQTHRSGHPPKVVSRFFERKRLICTMISLLRPLDSVCALLNVFFYAGVAISAVKHHVCSMCQISDLEPTMKSLRGTT